MLNLLDEDERPIPSVVCYEGAQKIRGRDAKRRLSETGRGVYGNIVRSPKMYLGGDGVIVDGVERSPVEMVRDVVDHVVEQSRISANARGHELGQVTTAVVTIPVDMDGVRRGALRDAFKMAGVRIVQFVHEPFAALYGLFQREDRNAALRRYDGKVVLVFDWGGGTLDLTLCRVKNGAVVQIKNDGTEEVGGDVFDEAIMNHCCPTKCIWERAWNPLCWYDWNCRKDQSNTGETKPVAHNNTVFAQVLKLVPRHEFESLARKHRSGRMARSMTRWGQFVAMGMAQLTDAAASGTSSRISRCSPASSTIWGSTW